MKKVASADTVRRADRLTAEKYLLPSMILMERAALSTADEISKRFPQPGRAVVLCGSGNNGGDGLAVSRLLMQRGWAVTALTMADEADYRGDAAKNHIIASRMGVDIRRFSSDALPQGTWDVAVDALLGSGLNREVVGEYAAAIEFYNALCAWKVAVDVPSGISSDGGKALGGAVRADQTVTFGCLKPGLLLFPGRDNAGEVKLADIGIPEAALSGAEGFVLEREDISRMLPERRADSHKGTYGHTLVIAGSKGMMGAGAMAANAALRSGAGLVSWLYPGGCTAAAASEVMAKPLGTGESFSLESVGEAMGYMEKKSAVCVGPGLGKNPELAQFLLMTLAGSKCRKLIDADGLNVISADVGVLRHLQEVVITPHPAEMARLSGLTREKILSDPVSCAKNFAAEYGCTVLLKGATSVIAAPDGRLCFNLTGNSGMAKGGSGDVLSGIITALLAQGMAPFEGACVGAWLAGTAADNAAARLGERSMTPTDTLEGVPEVLMGL